MALNKAPYRGTRDFFPADMRFRNFIFHKMAEVSEQFAYEPYDGPLLEEVELYLAKSGEELINDQIYSFIDRGERNVAIRPEMTPTLARMVAQIHREVPKPIRMYAIPNLMRYEKPQKDAVTIEPSGISVHPVGSHRDITLNMSDCLDLFPAICFLLSHVRGHHKLTGLANLAHKESDRLTEMSKILKVFSKKFKADNDSIQIEGSGDKFTETMNLELPDDHRIVMTAALFLRHHHGGLLSNPESVKKSYPEFFHLLK